MKETIRLLPLARASSSRSRAFACSPTTPIFSTGSLAAASPHETRQAFSAAVLLRHAPEPPLSSREDLRQLHLQTIAARWTRPLATLPKTLRPASLAETSLKTLFLTEHLLLVSCLWPVGSAHMFIVPGGGCMLLNIVSDKHIEACSVLPVQPTSRDLCARASPVDQVSGLFTLTLA